MRQPIVSKTPVWKAVALGAGIGLAMLSYPVHAAPASGGDTVQGLYDALLSTMKNGRTLRQSGRFTQLEPVIRRTFDIIRPPSTQVLHKNIHRFGGYRLTVLGTAI